MSKVQQGTPNPPAPDKGGWAGIQPIQRSLHLEIGHSLLDIGCSILHPMGVADATLVFEATLTSVNHCNIGFITSFNAFKITG